MAKIRGPQIANQAINTNHLVSGIVVNNVLLNKSAQATGSSVTFTVVNTLEISGTDDRTYDLDSLFAKSGGTISGSLTVTGAMTLSGGLVVPSGATLSVTNGTSTVTSADLIQALAGVATDATTVTAANLKTLTDGSDASALHTHSLSSLSFKETRALSKQATTSNDAITLNFGNASQMTVANVNTLASTDIEVYFNGQLIERGETEGYFTWTVNGTTGTVTFNGSVSGDHLYVKWRALAS